MKKQILILILCMVFLIGTVSAADWDNVKKYNDVDRSITVSNTFLRLFTTGEIAKVTPLTPHNVNVIRGENRTIAEFEIENYADGYSKVFKKIDLYNLKRGNTKEQRDFLFKYKEITGTKQEPIHERVCKDLIFKNETTYQECNTFVIGYETVNVIEWMDLDISKPLSKGNYTIRVITDVYPKEHMEFIPTWFGVRMPEYSEWTESLEVDLKAWWKYDETSGTDFVDSINGYYNGTGTNTEANVSGIINVAVNPTASGYVTVTNLTDIYNVSDTPFSVSLWFNSSSANSAFFFDMEELTGSTKSGFMVVMIGAEINFQIGYDTGSTNNNLVRGSGLDDGAWHHIVATYDGTDMRVFIDGSQSGAKLASLPPMYDHSTIYMEMGAGYNTGNPAWIAYQGGLDEVGFWHRNITVAEVTQLHNGGSAISPPAPTTAPTVSLNSPVNGTNATETSITFNGTVSANTNLTNVSMILDSTYNATNSSGLNNSNYIFTLDNLAEGNHNWTFEACDNTSQCTNATVRTFKIDSILPFVNITYPTQTISYHVINTNLSLNWTASDTNLASCWYDYNGTNVSVTCNDNTTNLNTTNYNNRNITLWANDTFGNYNSSYRIWNYSIFENSYNYNNETYEMNSETFSINVSSDGSEIILGYLIYNGTSYIATKTGDNYVMEFNRTITLDQKGNVSFYWSFDYGGEIINSSLFYQTVSEVLMGFCAGSLTIQTLNFTAYNEEDLSRLLPYGFQGTFEYWTGDGSVTKNFSISNASVNYVSICLNLNETFYSDAIIQYEKAGLVKRSYYLVNETLTNSTQNKSLFLLNTSSSTTFIIEVTDENQFTIEDVYVYIQRYYPGIDKYNTIEMALTDGSGSTVGHFEAETEDYRLIFEKDGVIIFQSGTQKIFCRETPCTLTFQTIAREGITWEDFGVIDLFSWTLDYETSINVWTLTYIDTSDSIGHGRLFVYSENPTTGKETICNTTSSLLADTLTCDVTGHNGTIYAAVYLSRSPETLVYLDSVVVRGLKLIFGLEGLFLSMFILLLLGLAGLWNPAVGIILIVVGMITLNIIGLASFGAVTIWGVVFIALLLLWKLKT